MHRGMPVGANGRDGTRPTRPPFRLPKPSNVTFTKDVAPIVQQHCQGCHRPGEGTPFSMLTYEDDAALGHGDEAHGGHPGDAAVV